MTADRLTRICISLLSAARVQSLRNACNHTQSMKEKGITEVE